MIKTLIKSHAKSLLRRLVSCFDSEILFNSDFSKVGLKLKAVDFLLLNSKGVLHIGAHEGQEVRKYSRFNLPCIWIEANPDIYKVLTNKIRMFSNQQALCYAINSFDGDTEFFVSSNHGHSSSLMKLSQDNTWNLLQNQTIKVKSRRLDSLFSSDYLDNFDFWCIDVQGAELNALRGSGSLLQKNCRYLLIEVSNVPQYESAPRYGEVHEFLEENGFYPLWVNSADHDDVIFINSNLLSK